jgi:hypothetical protein
MAGWPEKEHSQTLDQPTLHDLEREASVLCERIERLTRDTRFCSDSASRESALQLQAAAERRTQALLVLESGSREPEEIRLCRLEQLINALECSLDYFRPGEAELAL